MMSQDDGYKVQTIIVSKPVGNMRFVRICLFPDNGKQRNLLLELNVFRSEQELSVWGEERPRDSFL